MFMYNPYFSAYPEYSRQTLDWMPSDTEKLYKAHTKSTNPHTKEKLKELGFTGTNVKYKINKYGFRCDDFIKKDNIVFLGCSITLGIGINIEDSFTQIVANSLGFNNCNLGYAGGSMDACFRIASHWLPQLKPKLTVLVTPPAERSEIYQSRSRMHETLLPNMTRGNTWYVEYLKSKHNTDTNFLKNRLAIQQLCQDIDSRLVYIDSEWEGHAGVDKARDLMHPGKESNRLIANNMLEYLDV